MSRILVIAHLNHDRIWQLDSALASGARISWASRDIKLGGGGYFTGTQLLGLGHEVMLVACLSKDEFGQQARQTLSEKGFEMQHVYARDSDTRITDILLEPSGERTILNPSGVAERVFVLQDAVDADAAYFNCHQPQEQLLSAVAAIPFIVTQLPISNMSAARHADIAITSKSDFPDFSYEMLWARAQKLCGARLRHLVVTDGSRPVGIYNGDALCMVEVTKRKAAKNMIGAGDTFAASLMSAMLSGMTIEAAVSRASELTAEWLGHSI